MLLQHLIAFVYLLAGTITDFKKREVSDWANYGLIAMGLALNAYLSIVDWDWRPLAASVVVLCAFWLFGWLMCRAGQWGGGDSKLLMGLGALYGLDFFLVSFLVGSLFMGAIYGVAWSMVLAFRHREAFIKRFRGLAEEWKKWRILAFSALIASALLWLIWKPLFLFFTFCALIYLLLYLCMFIKAVEDSCMRKWIPPEKLTEGDWLAKKVIVSGKVLAGPDDKEGLSKSQVAKLQELARKGKVKKVYVKEGIPFVPSFLLGWIAALGIQPGLLFQLLQR
ncbi:prepilin peptidase [Candidatus Woesearchaeota archaeon]|nr:prepilin peptidase [Candidatus Woesearchaeota archaeon]